MFAYDIREAILSAMDLSDCSREMRDISAETIAEIVADDFEIAIDAKDVLMILEEA
jgi:hypothetical protein